MENLLSRIGRLFFNLSPPAPAISSADSPSIVSNSDLLPDQQVDFSSTINQLSYYQYLLEIDESIAPQSDEQKRQIASLQNDLLKPEVRQTWVPRMPEVMPRLLKNLRHEDVSRADLVDIINKDPAISAAVLKMANSAYFSFGRQPSLSLDRAVVKLGLKGLRSVLSAVVMQPVIQRKTVYFQHFGHKLWQHSLCCAQYCEKIAKSRALDPFRCYLTGLSHDIGTITLFGELCRRYEQSNSKQPEWNDFVPAINSLSIQLSSLIVNDWELPDEVCEAINQQSQSVQNMTSDYAVLLYQVNRLLECSSLVEIDVIDQDYVTGLMQYYNLTPLTALLQEQDAVDNY